jgi:hypothetical protein
MTATASVTPQPETKQPRRPERPEPTKDDLIAQLRADLTAERAINLRLSGYLDEVLGVELPDEYVPGWEGGDFAAYWEQLAVKSLYEDDLARRYHREGEPIPVMGPPPPADAPQHAA